MHSMKAQLIIRVGSYRSTHRSSTSQVLGKRWKELRRRWQSKQRARINDKYSPNRSAPSLCTCRFSWTCQRKRNIKIIANTGADTAAGARAARTACRRRRPKRKLRGRAATLKRAAARPDVARSWRVRHAGWRTLAAQAAAAGARAARASGYRSTSQRAGKAGSADRSLDMRLRLER